ncbi:MAG: heme exporter protein CcmB [Saprospirales bacterium]|nr:heme exporter protein CcmB [Saprospirales bacterium]MBK8492344.1 heme exporter protein CcmB [Saprospirales bacterium]
MQLIREIAFLLHKELTLELRQKYALGGILLYVLATVYVVYISFVKVDPANWNTLFWIIILFASVNAVARSFLQEHSGRQLYYYTLANPIAVLVAKILYNFLLLLLLSVLTLGAYSVVAGYLIRQPVPFLWAVLLGSLGFSIALTFVSAIASKASNASTLMAILSLPLLIPILATVIRLAKASFIPKAGVMIPIKSDLYILAGIDMLLLGAALILFSFLWRD